MSDLEPTRHRRPLDLVSLVAGLICAVLCLAFAVGDLDSFTEVSRVLWPTVLLGTGAGLLADSARG